MANFNRRGPNENGPMTGRGLGDCRGRDVDADLPRRNFRIRARETVNNNEDYNDFERGRGLGRGAARNDVRGAGRGRGRGRSNW